ncbi:MAG: SRPBCC family protein [Actinomycetota bacterium]|nr:SRPBCC family protein [Actinomycetota bacterium]
MSEFEATRTVPAPPDAVFAVVSDLATLDEWLPPGVHITPVADNVVTAEGPAVPESPREGVAGVSADQRRVEWGSRGDGRYAGWLQVHDENELGSDVTLHLSFLGEQPQAHGGAAAREVEQMLQESLDRLAGLVERRNSSA